MTDSGTGRVDVEGEKATLVFRRRLPHPPERVWKALTDPSELSSWYMTEARIDGRAGGTIEFHAGLSRLHVTGRVLTWDPHTSSSTSGKWRPGPSSRPERTR